MVAAARALRRTDVRTDPRIDPQWPSLRLVPRPRRRRRRRIGTGFRDAVFAATLAGLLAIGIMGGLLLNTAMQTQADRIALTKQQLAASALRIQSLQSDLDRAATPASLAVRAAGLGLRPAARLHVVAAPRHPAATLQSAAVQRALRGKISGREQAASRAHAG